MEGAKSTIREIKPPNKFVNYMALISSIIESSKLVGLKEIHDGGGCLGYCAKILGNLFLHGCSRSSFLMNMKC